MRQALALLLMTAATPAFAEIPPEISHFTLPNGLQTVVIEDHRAPVVVQMVWYKIGSADEKPGKSGIAHYLEHLMFKGTDKVAAGDLSKIVARNGGSDNAFTSYDYTAYFQRIASDRLPLVIEMEADRMQNLRIGEDDWKAERQVVLEERAQRTDSDPAAQFAEERAAAQFLNHPYGRPVIGWKQEMEGLTREDALAWYQAHYAPDDAVLILAGDVTPGEARKLAEQYYGPIPARGEATRTARPQEPAQRAARRMTLADPRVPQPVMIRSILAPERNPGDQTRAATLTVLAELLAGSPQTSVLGRELVLDGTALHVDADYDGLSVDPTTFDLALVPADGVTPEEAEAKLDASLARFAKAGPTEAEMTRVRTAIKADQVYDQDSAHGRAYEYGQGLATGLSVEDVAEWPQLLSAVTAEQVRKAAADLAASPASVTGWLLPGERAPVPASGADPLPDADAEVALPEDGAGMQAGQGDPEADVPGDDRPDDDGPDDGPGAHASGADEPIAGEAGAVAPANDTPATDAQASDLPAADAAGANGPGTDAPRADHPAASPQPADPPVTSPRPAARPSAPTAPPAAPPAPASAAAPEGASTPATPVPPAAPASAAPTTAPPAAPSPAAPAATPDQTPNEVPS